MSIAAVGTVTAEVAPAVDKRVRTEHRRYFREADTRKPLGLFVAHRIEGVIYASWSLCNDRDCFNKARAFQIASGRAKSVATKGYARRGPMEIQPELSRFIAGAAGFFQVEEDTVECPAFDDGLAKAELARRTKAYNKKLAEAAKATSAAGRILSTIPKKEEKA